MNHRIMVEKHSHTFKFLVFNDKKDNSIKFMNFNHNLENINNHLNREYSLIFSELEIMQIAAYLTNVNSEFLKFNGYTNYFNVNFNIFSEPLDYGESQISPFFSKKMNVNISLVSKKWNSFLVLKDKQIGFSNDKLPVKIYYIVKTDHEDHYIVYLDNISNQVKSTFESDIFQVIKENSRITTVFANISYDYLNNLIKTNNLLEAFTLDSDNTIHSIYSITYYEDNNTKRNYELKTTFKNQLLALLDKLFKEEIVNHNINISEYKYDLYG